MKYSVAAAACLASAPLLAQAGPPVPPPMAPAVQPVAVQPARGPKPLPLPITGSDPIDLVDAEGRAFAHRVAAIDVPLRLLPVSLDQPVAALWVKSERPESDLLATAEAEPMEIAHVQLGDAKAPRDVVLARAFLRDIGDPAPRHGIKGLIFCGSGIASATDAERYCLIDGDEDGAFEGISREFKPRQALIHSMIGIFQPARLATPLPYARSLEGLPRYGLDWRNCAQDWDKPYFRASLAGANASTLSNELTVGIIAALAAGTNDPQALARALSMAMMGNGQGGSACGRGEQVAFDGAAPPLALPAEQGAITVAMDALIFRVGPKKTGAKVQLIGTRWNGESYRIENGSLVSLAVGMTAEQADLATIQRFDRPAIMATGDTTVASGPVAIGGALLSYGITHGYGGELTEPVSIRTLLSSRSLPAGTRLYGLPAKESMTTYGGHYGSYGMPVSQPDPRRVTTRLVWCVPLREESPVKDKKGKLTGAMKVEWSASCLPDMNAGTHTIITGQQPAFAVSGMSFDATTSSNPGPPPVKRTDSVDFGAPITRRMRLLKVIANALYMREETLLGDEVATSRVARLSIDAQGLGHLGFENAAYSLKSAALPGGGNEVTITTLRPMRAGENAGPSSGYAFQPGLTYLTDRDYEKLEQDK